MQTELATIDQLKRDGVLRVPAKLAARMLCIGHSKLWELGKSGMLTPVYDEDVGGPAPGKSTYYLVWEIELYGLGRYDELRHRQREEAKRKKRFRAAR